MNGKTNAGFVNKENMAMLTDLYQLTMAASYLDHGKNGEATFELFVRKLPQKRGYLVAAGLEQVLDYLESMHFTGEDIEYLRQQGLFKEEFLEYLNNFKFTGNVSAIKEGTPIFNNEPILVVTAPRIEAQIVETYILNQINFQTMVASKASRVVEAAGSSSVVDFSLRRDHGTDAAMKAARASYIAGCKGTSNVLAGKEFGIPITGTMAHAYVMSFDDELEAFRAYAASFPENAVILIDTYDTVKGAKKAAVVARELEANGHKMKAVRIDSGNLVELSQKVREILDGAGLSYVKILASNDLNEYKIEELKKGGAKIDAYGVGTEMGVSRDEPAVGGVYKLVEDTGKDGRAVPKMKLSSGKVTLPGKKQVYRIIANGHYLKDIIAMEDEVFEGEPLLEKVMENGKRLQQKEKLSDVQARALENVAKIPSECKKVTGFGTYSVEVSNSLSKLTDDLKKRYGGK